MRKISKFSLISAGALFAASSALAANRSPALELRPNIQIAVQMDAQNQSTYSLTVTHRAGKVAIDESPIPCHSYRHCSILKTQLETQWNSDSNNVLAPLFGKKGLVFSEAERMESPSSIPNRYVCNDTLLEDNESKNLRSVISIKNDLLLSGKNKTRINSHCVMTLRNSHSRIAGSEKNDHYLFTLGKTDSLSVQSGTTQASLEFSDASPIERIDCNVDDLALFDHGSQISLNSGKDLKRILEEGGKVKALIGDSQLCEKSNISDSTLTDRNIKPARDAGVPSDLDASAKATITHEAR